MQNSCDTGMMIPNESISKRFSLPNRYGVTFVFNRIQFFAVLPLLFTFLFTIIIIHDR